jgi:predicted aspartyl protease
MTQLGNERIRFVHSPSVLIECLPARRGFSLALVMALYLAVTAGARIDPAQAEPGRQAGADPAIRFLDGAKSAGVDAIFFDNIIYLPCRVNGGSGLDFVLDTGASDISTLDERIAGDLGLTLVPGTTIAGAGPERVRMHELGQIRLSLPGMELTGFRVITIPLKRMEPYWGRKKDGLIGGNVLGRLVTQIDYDNHRITFHDPGSFAASGTGRVIPLTVEANTLFVNAKVVLEGAEGAIEGLFLLDTGVRMTFFNTPFTTKHGLIRSARRTVENIAGFGIGGASWGVMGRVASIRIGDMTVERPTVQFSTETKGVAASGGFDGVIGADILSRFHVTLDYQRREMILQQGESFSQPFEYDMSGLYLISGGEANDAFTVENVIKDSPAARAGAAKGDLLVSVDDRPASSFTLETLKRFLRQEGRSVTLRVNRAGQALDLSFRLERLI